MEAGAELRCVMWIVALATSATRTASLYAIVASGAMAGRVIVTTGRQQAMAMTMTATVNLASVLRAGVGRQKGTGPQPVTPRIMADNNRNGAGGPSPGTLGPARCTGTLITSI
jgi:hypothetical protein